jgi:tetratricopeptide (TPR) repeat protein
MLVAMQGDAVSGLALIRDGCETLRGAGLAVTAAGASMGEAWAAGWAGDHAAAEHALRSSLEVLERLGDRGYRPTVALQLAWLLYQESRYDEIETLCATGRAYTTAEDLINFAYLDMIEGCLCARRGQHAEAEERVRRALALAETTDFYWVRGTSGLFLAEALSLAGRRDEASEEAALGLAHFDAKGDIASAAQARERLDGLGIPIP